MKIKINEEQQFEFAMNVNGCSVDDLNGYFRIIFEDIEYGFPVIFEDDNVKVNIPIIGNIISENTRKSLYKNKKAIVNGRIDIIAKNESYLKAWEGEIEIEVPISVSVIEKTEKKDKKISIIENIIEKKDDNKQENKEITEKKQNKKKSKFSSMLDKK